jgi:magnesium transporter
MPRTPAPPDTSTTSKLDQFIGPRYLVTVHGPLNPAVPAAAAMVEVNAVLHRLESGRLRPTQAYELSHALVSALTGRLRDFTATLTRDVWKLEQRVTAGHLGDAEQFLDEMFRARHGLLTVQTMAALSREVFARMSKIRVFGTDQGQTRVEHTVDQFDRLRAMAHGQKGWVPSLTMTFMPRMEDTPVTGRVTAAITASRSAAMVILVW